MKITLIVIGKTTDSYLEKAITDYANRLKHYISFELEVIPELKNTKSLSVDQQKQREGELLLKILKTNDQVILLDETGKEYTSVQFSQYIANQMHLVSKRLVFVIGGPYGFSSPIYTIAQGQLSLSKMTFSHQMIRLLFVEQLYRTMTIINNEPYHHQ